MTCLVTQSLVSIISRRRKDHGNQRDNLLVLDNLGGSPGDLASDNLLGESPWESQNPFLGPLPAAPSWRGQSHMYHESSYDGHVIAYTIQCF